MADRPRKRGTSSGRRRRSGPKVTLRGRRRRYRRIHVDSGPRGPKILLVLLALLVLVALSLFYFGSKLRKAPVEVQDFVQAEVDNTRPYAELDPEIFRAELELFEEALFDTPGAGDGELELVGDDISNATVALRDRLRQAEGDRATEAAAGLVNLANNARAGKFDLQRLSAVREQWFRIRKDTFQQALWLRRDEGNNKDAADAAKLAVYQEAARTLEDLVENALMEAESLADEAAEGDRSEAGERRDIWRDALEGFRAELTDVRQRIPRRPTAGASEQLLAAVHLLEGAVDSSRRLLSSISSTPRQPVNRQPYMDTLEKIRLASDAFADLSYQV